MAEETHAPVWVYSKDIGFFCKICLRPADSTVEMTSLEPPHDVEEAPKRDERFVGLVDAVESYLNVRLSGAGVAELKKFYDGSTIQLKESARG